MEVDTELAPPRPGEVLLRKMVTRSWNQADMALVLGVSRSTVNQIVAGKRAITVEMALLLGAAFGSETDAELWLTMERDYRLWLLRDVDMEPIRQRLAAFNEGKALRAVKRSPLAEAQAEARALKAENERLRSALDAALAEARREERQRCREAVEAERIQPLERWPEYRDPYNEAIDDVLAAIDRLEGEA